MTDDGDCTIYERRPGACRAYDCRRDARVWIDFEARIPAPRK
jgi:Fe-S-cluster containining protein